MPPPENKGNTEDKKARYPLGQNNEDGVFPNNPMKSPEHGG